MSSDAERDALKRDEVGRLGWMALMLTPEMGPTRIARAMERLNENRRGSLLDFVGDFVRRFPKCVDEYEELLTGNRIWMGRLTNVGVLTADECKEYGVTGPLLHAIADLGFTYTTPIQSAARRPRPYRPILCSDALSRRAPWTSTPLSAIPRNR